MQSMDVVAHLASETKVVSVQKNIHFRDLLAALEAAFDTNTLHITAIRSTSNGHLDASGSSSMGTSLLETFEEVEEFWTSLYFLFVLNVSF
jgi:hypothetical protein